jgi:hypothetical protein
MLAAAPIMQAGMGKLVYGLGGAPY